MKDIVKIYKALSDETRLRILNLLHDGELCVCHIMDILHMGQSKVSRHLTYLKNAGLVHDRRKGLWVYYSLSKNKSYIPMLRCLKELRMEVRELKVDSERLLKMKKAAKLSGITIDKYLIISKIKSNKGKARCRC
ncbi:MAG: winged helix-turn-helix transcriptional regulator [Deltaproteobacteria bacterium]|nr:winged helix-turn-helix transcriptional regulator [Deltaproteobacteria bacterium]